MRDEATFDQGGALPPGIGLVFNATADAISVTPGRYHGSTEDGVLVLRPVDPNQPHAEDANCWCEPTVENFG